MLTLKSYCVKCRRVRKIDQEKTKLNVTSYNGGRLMLMSKCPACGTQMGRVTKPDDVRAFFGPKGGDWRQKVKKFEIMQEHQRAKYEQGN